MDTSQALEILKALARGTDPHSGEAPLLQHPDTVRALYCGIAAVEAIDARNQPSPPKPRALPGNSGKPWSKDEDERLITAFDAGQAVDALAVVHARSRLAIEARLARFGRLPTPAGLRGLPPGPASPRSIPPRDGTPPLAVGERPAPNYLPA